MVGTDTTPFSGTFDGDGHTLTFNSGTKDSPVTTGCAPSTSSVIHPSPPPSPEKTTPLPAAGNQVMPANTRSGTRRSE